MPRPRILPASPRSRHGFTFIELAVGMTVLLVALLILSSVVSSMAKQRAVNRETSLAVSAARNMLETLRAEDFSDVYALYNSDPADDPLGAGTAPGNRFAVEDLLEAPDSPDTLEGEVVFPTATDPVEGLQLREDVVDRALGMPRDLSGDNVTDAEDHSLDYFILPVQVRVRWTSPNGPRQYDMTTQLSRYNKP
jgi:prepilin-type N-terminal cleavage/methylation domain-containing protein